MEIGPKPVAASKRANPMLLRHGHMMLTRGVVEHIARLALMKSGSVHSVVARMLFDFAEAGNDLVSVVPDRSNDWWFILMEPSHRLPRSRP